MVEIKKVGLQDKDILLELLVKMLKEFDFKNSKSEVAKKLWNKFILDYTKGEYDKRNDSFIFRVGNGNRN